MDLTSLLLTPFGILIAINVIVFILPFVVQFGGPRSNSFDNFQMLGWKDNSDVKDGEYYRLLTSNFLHADIFHLFFNMYALYLYGPFVTMAFGSLGFAIIYFSSGIMGSLFSFWFNNSPSVGASGAIFGLIGSMLAVAIRTGNVGFGVNIAFIILINFVYAFDPQRRIDNFGHLGGLLAGFVIAFALMLFSPNQLSVS